LSFDGANFHEPKYRSQPSRKSFPERSRSCNDRPSTFDRDGPIKEDGGRGNALTPTDQWNHKECEEPFRRKHAAYNAVHGALEHFLNARALQEASGKREDLLPDMQPFFNSITELKDILEGMKEQRSRDPENQIMRERFDQGVLVGDWLSNRAAEREMELLCSGDSPASVLSEIARFAHPRQMSFDKWHVHYIVALWIARTPTTSQER
jgi:hypothetical protein